MCRTLVAILLYGDHTRPNAYSRLRYAQMFIPRIMDQIRRTDPAGADTLSWRY